MFAPDARDANSSSNRPRRGLGLASAVRVRVAAHWSSWADSLRIIGQRHPHIAEFIVAAWQTAQCHVSKQYVSANGRWLPLVSRCLLGMNCQTLPQPQRKNQNRISQSSDGSRRRPGSWRRSSSMRWCGQDWKTPAEPCSSSTTGPLASALFTAVPTSRFTRPFPCAPANVAANLICLATIVQRVPWQGSEWFPVGMRSSPGVQRGWGTGVHKRSCQRLGPHRPQRCRRPVADGLSLWHGAQLAIDMVFLLHSDGSARRRAADHDGAALEVARRRKERTYPELTGEGGRARLVVLAAEVGWSEETATFLAALAKARVESSSIHFAGQGQAAMIRQWMLACSAARAFAVSCSTAVPMPGIGRVIPSVASQKKKKKRLDLPLWTMIWAIRVLADKSKCLDIPILEFSMTSERSGYCCLSCASRTSLMSMIFAAVICGA